MNEKTRKAIFSHKSDDWATPKEIYDEFITQGYFDPCPLYSKFDGLSINWKSYNFVNPPYSDIKNWVNKSLEEVEKGNNVVLLVPSRTDTKWFHTILNSGKLYTLRFVKGRLKFGNSKKQCTISKCIHIFRF